MVVGTTTLTSSNNSNNANMLAKVESSLLQSLNDLHVRNEVDECVRSMLFDVETTHHLQQQLNLQLVQGKLLQSQTEQRATILEANAERLERQDRRIQLADHMVAEIAKLNRELQHLQQWKVDHEYKVQNYDSVLAKLAQTEEELQEANRVSFGGGGPPPRGGQQQEQEREDGTPFSTPPKQQQQHQQQQNGGVGEGSYTTNKGGGTSATTEGVATVTATSRTLFHDPTPTEPQPQPQPSATVDPTKESIPENTPEIVPPMDVSDFANSNDVTTVVSDATTVDVFAGFTPEETNEVKTSSINDVIVPPVTLLEPPVTVIGPSHAVIPDSHLEQVSSVDEEDKKPAASAAVVLVEEDVPTLLTLDVEALMNIFGFIDAIDILNTAQINATMYHKVDNIFGISEDGQTPPAPTPQPAPVPAPVPVPAPKLLPPIQPAAGVPTAGTAGMVTPSFAASKPAPVGSKPSIVDSTSGPLGKGLFALLQPKPAASLTSPSATATATATALAARAGTSQPQPLYQPMNAKVAQSMSAKLSDAEVSAIIAMTDKLSKFEKEVHLLRNEKEVLSAKLDGTEAVKQFLIGKVREVEVKLTRSREDEIKVTQQIASDQEVIAFLDSRVQELEQLTEDLTKVNSTMEKELETLRVSTSKKITILSDMLKYEREKVREDESEWKATKKVLVREVKSCRAQLLALQAERDGFKEQNDMLKRAIVSTGGGGGSSSSSSSKNNASHYHNNNNNNGPSHHNARRKLT